MQTNKLDNLEGMDKFLESYNLSGLNQEKNLNRSITGKELETCNQKPSPKHKSRTRWMNY